MNRFDYIF